MKKIEENGENLRENYEKSEKHYYYSFSRFHGILHSLVPESIYNYATFVKI